MKKAAIFTLLLTLQTSAFSQASTKLHIPSDAKAEYTIINQGGTRNQPTLTTKRVGSSGTNYSKRIFDCNMQTTKYLGTGETLEEMKKSLPDPQMSMIIEGSIAYYQWKYVCKR